LTSLRTGVRLRPRLVDYVFVVAMCGLALALTLALGGHGRSFFVFYGAAIIVSAWRGGWRCAVLAAVLVLLDQAYMGFPPLVTVLSSSIFVVRLGALTALVACTTIISSCLSESIRRNRQLLAQEREARAAAELATATAQEGEAKFRSLFENSLDAIFLTISDGAIAGANSAACALFRMTEEELCGTGEGLFQRDDPHHASFLEQRARTGKMTGELSWIRRDGSKFTAEVSSVILGGEPPRSFVVLRDITQRKAAEEALRANEERIHAIVGSAMDAIISINEQQRIIVFNRAAEKIFRCAASEALGSPLDRFIPAEYRTVHQEHIRKFAENGLTTCSVQAPRTLKAVRSNGEEFPVEIAVSRVQAGKERIYTAILRDITRRNRAEEGLRTSQEQMRALAARVQSVAEEERLRISRELHDQLGQALTAIKMDLDWLARKHKPGEEAWTEQIQDTLQLVDSTIGLVRKLSTELRPAILDTCGLSAALELQAEEFRRRTGIPCSVQAPESRIGLSPEQRITVFRICQEVLTNIARHAGASQVDVTFEGTGAHAVFTVKDDGKGFNIDKLDPRRSLGILGMRERALMAGGMLDIRSAPGAGTQITLRIPLNSGTIGAEQN